MREATVTQVVQNIKSLIEGEFRQVIVSGEVTNLSKSHSGHWYFTLSDQSSSISVALFKREALRNPIINKIKDGERLICSGSIGVYAPRGTFQLISTQIICAGKGALLEKFELLKKKLAAEGLFDLSHKKKIPFFPQKIAIITAQKGAAVQDFIKIYKRRSWTGYLLIIPTLVQGERASMSIRSALKKASFGIHGVDLIVLTRGGGSIEDLWAFNDEELARDIFACEIPIITGIGHQTDYTIADHVADLRLETPSAAAEYITAEQINVSLRIAQSISSMKLIARQNMSQLRTKLALLHPFKISATISRLFFNKRQRLESVNIVREGEKIIKLTEKKLTLDQLNTKLVRELTDRLGLKKQRIKILSEKLSVLDPKNILKRGYSILEDCDGNIVASNEMFHKYKKNEKMLINFCDGKGIVSKNG